MNRKTGVVCDRRYMDHRMGPYHPESPSRIEILLRMLEQETAFPYLAIDPRPASGEEIETVHERGYVDLIRSTAGKGAVVLDSDTSTGPLSYETALLAAGGLLQILDFIMEDRIRNGMALVRPPGHHAEASRAMGFCLFNNVAVGAEHLIRKYGLKRILIVDWDLHHGNGTEHMFYNRRDVLYFSTHQSSHYPGTGAVNDLGFEAGRGFNINVPLMAGKDDNDFLFVYQNILTPIALQYAPEFILVSAGFDIGSRDPLGGMAVTREGFGFLASSLLALAEEAVEGRIALVLEGGYHPGDLKDGVEETLGRLSADNPQPLPSSPPATPALKSEIGPCFRAFKEFWAV